VSVKPFQCAKESAKVKTTGIRMNATKKRMAGRVKRNPVRAVVFLMIGRSFLG
jgi:hypothetical protein